MYGVLKVSNVHINLCQKYNICIQARHRSTVFCIFAICKARVSERRKKEQEGTFSVTHKSQFLFYNKVVENTSWNFCNTSVTQRSKVLFCTDVVLENIGNNQEVLLCGPF